MIHRSLTRPAQRRAHTVRLGLATLLMFTLGLAMMSESSNAEEEPDTIEVTGRIELRRAGDGRLEAGFKPQGGESIRPDEHPLPVHCATEDWISSSPITFRGVQLGSVISRSLGGGWSEVAFRTSDGEDLLPEARFVRPGTATNLLVSSTITISIPRPDVTPRFTRSVSSQALYLNQGIGLFTLPEAFVEWWDLSYSLKTEVPGLTFNPDTRRLSGRPTEAGTYAMIFRVRSSGGGSAELHFDIEVRVPEAARFADEDDSMMEDYDDDSMMEDSADSMFDESEDEAEESDEPADSSSAPRPPLTAGEIDDNERWQDYLHYREQFSWLNVLDVDVSERYVVSVSDSFGRSVHNARVVVLADSRVLFEGMTYANGQTLFFPRATAGHEQVTSFTLCVDKDGERVQRKFARGQHQDWSVSLPMQRPESERIPLDILFLLDSTGSMSDQIERIKDTLLSVASRIAHLPSQPDLRFAMVAYRDRGDEYVTRVFDFETDPSRFLETIRGIEAAGGGDYPESVNEAMHVAVHDPAWRFKSGIRLMFLIADAPPKLSYPNDYSYAEEMMEAHRRGIKIFPIASSGLDDQGEYVFRQIAQHTMGRFIFIVYGERGTTPHHVGQYSVERLDDVVVSLVEAELAQLSSGGDN